MMVGNKMNNWKLAMGIQRTAGLKTSSYFHELARAHGQNELALSDVRRRIDNKYARAYAICLVERTEEADRVAARMAEQLFHPFFALSAATYLNIHRLLFQRIKNGGGKLRSQNLSCSRTVSEGKSLICPPAEKVIGLLEEVLAAEAVFSYTGLSKSETIAHLAGWFTALWQIQPFQEGNTRTALFFLVLYLQNLGFQLNPDWLFDHGLELHDALAAACCSDPAQKIRPDFSGLEQWLAQFIL